MYTVAEGNRGGSSAAKGNTKKRSIHAKRTFFISISQYRLTIHIVPATIPTEKRGKRKSCAGYCTALFM
jgi:hypothetical protein